MILISNWIRYILAIVVFTISPGISAEVWDLANDWSDTANPNGVWSYNGSPGTPITTHWDDWDPSSGCCFSDPQPAWSATQWPNTGHVPMWMKVRSEATSGTPDFPIGRVLMHGAEFLDPPAQAGVGWTSPIDGVVTISGGVWLADFTGSRAMDWSILVNRIVISTGSLTPTSPFSSSAPFRFEDGSGGQAVLTFEVSVGDVVTVEFSKASTLATFVGIDFTIDTDLDIVDNLSTAVRLGELFQHQLEVVAGIAPIDWNVVSGELPPGLTLNENGIIAGLPTETGNSTFTVQAMDSGNSIVERTFNLDVVLVLPPADISINKGSTVIVPGREIEYYASIENIGDSTASGVVVSELLEPWFTLVDADPTPPRIVQGNDPFPPELPDPVYDVWLEWQIPDLAPGEKFIINYRVLLDPIFPLGETASGPMCLTVPEAEECRDDYIQCLGGAAAECIASVGIGPQYAACFAKKSATCVLLYTRYMFDFTFDCDLQQDPATGPKDPNVKFVLADKFIGADETLVYPIHFENIGEIEALDVFITDVLDPNLDDSSLEILTPGAIYDPETRTIRWELLGINLQPGATDNVLLSIKPVPGLASGTEIKNSAEIQFEVFETLITPEVVNVIDTSTPECTIDALPAQTVNPVIELSWTGSDAVGEIANYTVFHAVNDGDFLPLLVEVPETVTSFTGAVGEVHHFFCVAEDTAENAEGGTSDPEASIEIVPDSDSDGIQDTLDNCPLDANSDQSDFDGDGEGDACDADRDGDGTPNDFDAFPDDPSEAADNDDDGVGDNADTDDDNDGYSDVEESACGSNPNEAANTCANIDSDGDGVIDSLDNCPTESNPDQADDDGDGIGNSCDSPEERVCSVDDDGDVDRNDLRLILRGRGSVPNDGFDPRDANMDGQISFRDFLKCVWKCDRRFCRVR